MESSTVESLRTKLSTTLPTSTIDTLCPPTSERTRLSSLSSLPTEEMVAIVGGGLSGLEAARIHREGGREVVVFEKSLSLGGVWVTTANAASRVQVDPVSFRPLHDTTPLGQGDPPFDSFYRNREQVLAQMAQDVAQASLGQTIVFGVSVIAFEDAGDGKVKVVVEEANGEEEDGGSAKVWEFVFRELHIRTGSLTDHAGGLAALGIDDSTFTGIAARGIANDVDEATLEGADVVIVGLGAFAVENVRRSLAAGAKSITVLSRKADKLLFPEAATFVLRHTLNACPGGIPTQDELDAMWARVFDLVKTGATVAGLEEILLNDNTVSLVQGKEHFVFSNGLPAMSSNVLLLGAAYGLVDIRIDQLASLSASQVTTKSGATLPCDVLLTCLGFGTSDTLLAGHTVTDAWFVDGCRNITHNLRGDRVNGSNIIGPRAELASNFLISYYEDADEYERSLRRICDAPPSVYQEIVDMDPVSSPTDVASVDYFTTLVLSDKLLRSSDPEIIRILENNRTARTALYDLILPGDVFWQRDAAAWNTISTHLAHQTGTPTPIPYPFAP